MLDAALKVIDAARSMKLVSKGGRTMSELPHLDLALAIESVRLALESFDRETAASVRSPAPIPKPDWASPPQMNDDGFIVRDVNLAPEYVEQPLPETAEALIEAEEALEREQEDAPSGPRMPILRAVAAAAAREGLNPVGLDMGDEGAFFDGDESAGDLLLAIDSINDKLAYAVGKVGWSPRLRALAEAARIAQNNMYIEVEGDRGWVRVPAHNWGTLSVAIAEAALDQDLSIALPRPRPAQADHEYDMAPKPKFR